MFAVFFLAYLEPRELVVVLVWLCQTSLGDIRSCRIDGLYVFLFLLYIDEVYFWSKNKSDILK